MSIYVRHNGQGVGPLTVEEIRAKLAFGGLAHTDEAWHKKSGRWIPLSEFPGLTPRADHNLPTPFSLGSYTPRHFLTLVVFFVAAGLAVSALSHFLNAGFPTTRAEFLEDGFGVFSIYFWILAPPVWFFFEFFVLWAGASEADLKRVQDGQKLAQALWGAILVPLLLLIPK